MSSRSLTKSLPVRRNSGFTIAEMLVSIAIVVIITGIIFSNRSQLGAGATLRNIVNDLTLSLRQAQIYGISVKQFNADSDPAKKFSTSNFDSGYGVHFDISAPPTGNNGAYLFFADVQASPKNAQHPNGMYGGSDMSCPPFGNTTILECLNKVTLGTGYTITALCTSRSGVRDCAPTKLDISFMRPATEARIIFGADSISLALACIEVSAPDGRKTAILVFSTGQISTFNVTCASLL